MAFIMTSTIAEGRGAAWAGARARIEKTCDLECLIVSREPGRFNFSASTNLQECMFVARKRKNGETPKDRALFCVLSENPQNGNMALGTALAILDAEESGAEWGKLRIDKREIGEFARLRYRGKSTWDGIAFLNFQLSAVQLKSLARAFDKIAGVDFLPIPQMAECPARKAADDAFARALNLDDFDFAALRNALAAEPIITGK